MAIGELDKIGRSSDPNQTREDRMNQVRKLCGCAPGSGNRVPCTAADRPLDGASSDKPDRLGTTDVPASTMTGTLADPRDP